MHSYKPKENQTNDFTKPWMRVDRLKKNDLQLTFSAVVERQHLLEMVKGTKLELPALAAIFCCLHHRKVLAQVGCH